MASTPRVPEETPTTIAVARLEEQVSFLAAEVKDLHASIENLREKQRSVPLWVTALLTLETTVIGALSAVLITHALGGG